MSQEGIQSIVRAAAILKCFDGHPELGVTDISNRVGLHKSTAFNIIKTLKHCGYLEQNENTGKYRLGIELFRIGTKVESDLRKLTHPYLEELVAQFKETVNLVVRDKEQVVYMEKIDSPHSMRFSTAVGESRPVYATAVGKAILSGLFEKQLQEAVKKIVFKKYTKNTISDQDELLAQVQKARSKGYAEDFEELEEGLICVAAPIYNHTGEAFAAISVSGPTSRMNEEFRRRLALRLVDMGGCLSQKFGYKDQG